MDKFDKIIMNPPYDYSMHLRILEKALVHLKDHGTCVNLSPVRWLEDPLAKDKKNSDYLRFGDSVLKHIQSVEKIPMIETNKLFGINFYDLGIYALDTEDHDVHLPCFENKSVNKIKELAKLDNVMMHSTPEGPSQTYEGEFGVITSHYNDLGNWVSSNECLWTKARFNHTTKKIVFEHHCEIGNFFRSLLTETFKGYARMVKKNQRQPWQAVPWLGGQINPRTKVKGYMSEWTDEDLCKLFEIDLNELICDDQSKKDFLIGTGTSHNVSEEIVQMIVQEDFWWKEQFDEGICDKKNFDQFFTPHELIIRMIKMFEDLNGDILDPAVGSGGLLVAMIFAGADPERCYGIELDPNIAEICRERLSFLGVPRKNIKTGDSLDCSSYKFD